MWSNLDSKGPGWQMKRCYYNDACTPADSC